MTIDEIKLLDASPKYQVKDSGQRASFASGMVRDITEGKTDTLLVRDGPMFWRWAVHLTKGAVKYAKRNWMLAAGQVEYDRFRESAARHFEQWLRGETDEDHAAAVFFNINGAEFVKERLCLLESTSAQCAGSESNGSNTPQIPTSPSARDVGNINRSTSRCSDPYPERPSR